MACATANEPIRVANEVTSQWHAWQAFSKYLLDDVDVAPSLAGMPMPTWSRRRMYARMWTASSTPCCSRRAIIRGLPILTLPTREVRTIPSRKTTSVLRRVFRCVWGRGLNGSRSPRTSWRCPCPRGRSGGGTCPPAQTGQWQKATRHPLVTSRRAEYRVGHAAIAVAAKRRVSKVKKPVSKGWLATSEPQLTCQALPVVGGTVKVPQLRVWSMVIAEMEGK